MEDLVAGCGTPGKHVSWNECTRHNLEYTRYKPFFVKLIMTRDHSYTYFHIKRQRKAQDNRSDGMYYVEL